MPSHYTELALVREHLADLNCQRHTLKRTKAALHIQLRRKNLHPLQKDRLLYELADVVQRLPLVKKNSKTVDEFYTFASCYAGGHP